MEWISVVEYPKHHEEVRRSRVEDTCEWLLRDQRFRDWENSASSAVLWLRGDRESSEPTLVSSMFVGFAANYTYQLARAKHFSLPRLLITSRTGPNPQ